jgi:4-amino-4-deoxy-L-arabinose transferase-like glycosyltransferase
MVFFAPSILIWLLVVPRQREWLFTAWPWIGGFVAVMVFSPVLFWNAEHGWASVLYQSQRLVVRHLQLSYIAEYPLSQSGLATPSIFLLGCMAIARFFREPGEQLSSRVLISALVLPLALYFMWHSFHGRVEGNWPMPMLPAFAVAAAVGAEGFEWRGFAGGLVTWSRRLAAPVSIALMAVIYLQAVFGIIPLGSVDPTARALGAGWPQLATEIDRIRQLTGASVVLTADYGVTSWLSFYLPSRAPVEQINGRMRWINEPVPDQKLFEGPMVFVCQGACSLAKWLAKRFKDVELVSTLERMRNGIPIVPYAIYRVAEPIGELLDSPYERSSIALKAALK